MSIRKIGSKPLPQEIEAEKALLGSLIREGDLYEKIENIITPEDFYKEDHKIIFTCMLKLRKQNNPIDILSVFQELKENEKVYSENIEPLYLTHLTEMVPTTANIEYYAKLVQKTSNQRKIYKDLVGIVGNLEDGKLTSEEVYLKLHELNIVTAHTELKPVSARDLVEEPVVEPLWGDLFFPACITQINSEPGVGKTTFVLNVAINGCKGVDFLDVPFSKNLKILYVDIETPKWRSNQKVTMISGGDKPKELYFLYNLDLENAFVDFLSLCKGENYDLIIFDTQSRVFNMEQENDNSEANKKIGLVNKIINETGTGIVLVHHTSKSERKGVYSGRGASAISGSADIVVNLESLDEEIIKVATAKNRVSGDYQNFYIKKLGEDLFEPYQPPDEQSTGLEKFRIQKIILSLSKERTWKTSELQELGRNEGFSESTITRAIRNLKETGKLEKIKQGEYRIIGFSQKVKKSDYIPDRSDYLTKSGSTDDLSNNHSEICDCNKCCPDGHDDMDFDTKNF